MQLHYLVIPLVVVFVAWIGGRFTARSVREWYPSLQKPSWTPPGSIIGAVWTVFYILAGTSAIFVWDVPGGPGILLAGMFVANAFLNALWSYVFFALRKMNAAIAVCLLLDLTIIFLIVLTVPISVFAAWLLAPYLLWVTFASYLNYRISAMNH